MLVVDHAKYKMLIFEDKKQVHVQIDGFLKDKTVDEYMIDLQETVGKVNKRLFTFVVDATYQSPLPRKIAAGLGDTLMFYTTLGFKDVFVVYPKSKISTVQIRNTLETINFPGFFVESVSQLPK